MIESKVRAVLFQFTAACGKCFRNPKLADNSRFLSLSKYLHDYDC